MASPPDEGQDALAAEGYRLYSAEAAEFAAATSDAFAEVLGDVWAHNT